jgi:CHAD domain-containing protein
MAYRIKHGESVPEGVRRIAREELGTAAQCLRGKNGADADERVHEARKSLKKTRALLRLIRPSLGDVYAAENDRLREAGRKLSPIRDAAVMPQVFDHLRERIDKKAGGGSLAAIRRRLGLHKKHLVQESIEQKLMEGVAGSLIESRQSIKKWPLDVDGFAAIELGFEKAFRDGKKAFATALKSGHRRNFHEWRKRVKDHWYHVRLLENLWSDLMTGYEHSLKDLEDALGEDLNLAILRDHLLSTPDGTANHPAPDCVIAALDSSRTELRSRAVEIGERVYAEKPGRLTRHMERLWDAWRGAKTHVA